MNMFYQFKEIAYSNIQRFGKRITLIKKGTSTYVAGQGVVNTDDTQIDFYAIIDSFGNNEIGELIKAGDIKIVVAENDTKYNISDDKVMIDNIKYNIVNINKVYGGEIVITNEIQLRR